MRLAVCGVVLLATASLFAQFPTPNLQSGFGELRQRGLLPDPPAPQKLPLDPREQTPKPEPDLTTREGQIPPPNPTNDQSREIRIIKAPKHRRTGDIVTLSGGVHIQYRGYDILANEISGDLRTEVFTLKGGGNLIGADGVVKAEMLTIDFKNEVFLAQDYVGKVGPSAAGGRLLSDLYLAGELASGTKKEIIIEDGNCTTCDLATPHYHLSGKTVTVRPDKRVLIRDAKIRINDRVVLRVPFLSIPLDTRREGYTPEFGRSPDQGYYVKSTWAVPISGSRSLDANLDYFELLGVGLGGRYRFASANQTGFLRTYGIVGDSSSLEVQGGLRQRFGDSLLAIESNLQQRNYINAPQNTTISTRANLTIPNGRNNTRVNFNQYSNESNLFRTESRSFGISDQRIFPNKLRTDLEIVYGSSKSTFSASDPVERSQVDVRFKGLQEFRSFVAELDYQRSIPIGETVNFFSGTDRTPVLAVRTDSRRVMNNAMAQRYPWRAEFSVGEFASTLNDGPVTRTYFDIDLNQADNFRARQGIGVYARFRQGVYSDGTAQFASQLNASYRYQFTNDTSFNVRYNYLRPRGFTPLSIDRIGSSNFLSSDISVKLGRPITFGLQTGYDFRYSDLGLATPWQQIAARLEYKPSNQVQARALSIYDPTQKQWTSTRLDAVYDTGTFYLGLGARYDDIRNTWANINVYVDGIRFGRVSATALLNYNGYTKQFDSRQVQLVYDMHCTEAVFQVVENNVGFRSGREYFFFLRIKALPFQPPFGIGRRGQPFGTATGAGF